MRAAGGQRSTQVPQATQRSGSKRGAEPESNTSPGRGWRSISPTTSQTRYQRCLACYPTNDTDEKIRQLKVANTRLGVLYDELAQAGILFERKFFT